MTGMKEGAGEDPFAEDEESIEEESAGEDTGGTNLDREPDSSDRGGRSERQQIQIPYKFRREGVQDGRERVPLFLQPETKTGEREALRELEERFDDDVALTDLREAVVKAGLNNLDEVERHLEEWGYGMEFNE